MATIPNPGTELRHVRKTVTFDGSANNGLLGDQVPVFTITGRVIVDRLTAYITSDLVCTAGALTSIGFAGAGASSLGSSVTVDNWTAGLWYRTTGTIDDIGTALPRDITITQMAPEATAVNIVMHVIDEGGGANVTGGVVVVDVWYRPITDDGALAGDDIDEDLKTNIWSKALSDIASVPAITASALSALNWLFALARNKRTQTATTETVYKDDGSTSLATSTKSDDGTTYTRGEYS